MFEMIRRKVKTVFLKSLNSIGYIVSYNIMMVPHGLLLRNSRMQVICYVLANS